MHLASIYLIDIMHIHTYAHIHSYMFASSIKLYLKNKVFNFNRELNVCHCAVINVKSFLKSISYI